MTREYNNPHNPTITPTPSPSDGLDPLDLQNMVDEQKQQGIGTTPPPNPTANNSNIISFLEMERKENKEVKQR